MADFGDYVLYVKNLTRKFGALVAIDDLTLGVKERELRCLIGPNGAGKTTLFNLITGYLRPSFGCIYFRGQPITRLSPSKICRLGIGRKFQTPSIFDNLSVLENILIAGEGKGKISDLVLRKFSETDHCHAGKILQQIHLSPKKDLLASTLPHAERQWLEIGMVLRNQPQLLLLDEPTAGLTASETKEIANLIMAIAKNLTIVVIEHDIRFVKDVAREVTVLHKGKILVQGSFEEIKKNQDVKNVYLGRDK